MIGKAHFRSTAYSLGLLRRVSREDHDKIGACAGRCAEVRALRKRAANFDKLHFSAQLEQEVAEVDNYRDLEFVDVEGGFGSGGRDNPHESEWTAIDDEAHYSQGARVLTGFNHFIDIRKGPGAFDDYDGYAYHKGSASQGQYQSAQDAASSVSEWIGATLTGYKVDEGVVGYYYNDEYVHAPGQQWYKGCSPAIERYSYTADKHIYANREAEAKARFPLADSTGAANKGIPYSVFMPVDNMARYWHTRFRQTQDLLCLGPVLHAIQDASIPHHAAGCLGNWHSKYEDQVSDARIVSWFGTAAAQVEASKLVAQWIWQDPNPPGTLTPNDYGRRPALNWPVQQLVTWVALNAYHEYAQTYGGFRSNQFNEGSAHRLTQFAVAMSALVMKKAASDI